VLSFAFFAIAARALEARDYTSLTLLWSVTFLAVSVLLRPVEQLLARELASRGATRGNVRETAGLLAAGVGVLVILVVAGREQLRGLFDSDVAVWALAATCAAFAATSFVRGLLAGHGRFGAYTAVNLVEALVRVVVAAAVLVGLEPGFELLAFSLAAGPLVALAVVPPRTHNVTDGDPGTTSSRRARLGFTGAATTVALSEQVILTAPVVVLALADAPAPAIALTFNLMLVARAPLQILQAVQTVLLPYLAGLHAAGALTSLRDTLVKVAGSALAAGAVAVVLAAMIGPEAMRVLFGDLATDSGLTAGLLVAGLTMHAVAALVAQGALAIGAGPPSARVWVAATAGSVVWLVLVPEPSPMDVAAGYAMATACLGVGQVATVLNRLRG